MRAQRPFRGGRRGARLGFSPGTRGALARRGLPPVGAPHRQAQLHPLARPEPAGPTDPAAPASGAGDHFLVPDQPTAASPSASGCSGWRASRRQRRRAPRIYPRDHRGAARRCTCRTPPRVAHNRTAPTTTAVDPCAICREGPRLAPASPASRNCIGGLAWSPCAGQPSAGPSVSAPRWPTAPPIPAPSRTPPRRSPATAPAG